jgi:hypothetical protein
LAKTPNISTLRRVDLFEPVLLTLLSIVILPSYTFLNGQVRITLIILTTEENSIIPPIAILRLTVEFHQRLIRRSTPKIMVSTESIARIHQAVRPARLA